ncbi:MAG: hypothetical protein H6836_05545 [Planctomycetes bacterium]|nr:hypothetical protein [Planctomycetota bacterium]MCB9889021.1 hypothetical protein [Planctomycetota bacterium]
MLASRTIPRVVRFALCAVSIACAVSLPSQAKQGDGEPDKPQIPAPPRPVVLDAIARETVDAWQRRCYHLGRAGVRHFTCTVEVRSQGGMTGTWTTRGKLRWDAAELPLGRLEWEDADAATALLRRGWNADFFTRELRPDGLLAQLAGTKVTGHRRANGTILEAKGEPGRPVQALLFDRAGSLVGRLVGPMKKAIRHQEIGGRLVHVGDTFRMERSRGTVEIRHREVDGFLIPERIHEVVQVDGQTVSDLTFTLRDIRLVGQPKAAVRPAKREDTAHKLAVYVLCGQSNMQGHAKVQTLDYLGDDPATAPLLAEIRGPDGKPRVCDRVWISYLTAGRKGDAVAVGKLTTGYGARQDPAKDGGKIGPELTFGLRIAKAHPGPILLIKCAWGGKSLHTDFRPPSAGAYPWDPKVLARMETQHKDVAKIKADKVAATGRYYRSVIEHVKRVLANPERVCPSYDPKLGYELRGFVWFQGWNDMVDSGTYPQRDKPGGYAAYSTCLAHLIRDVRKDLGAPGLPFVIGVMGVGGELDPKGRHTKVNAAFRAAMAQPAELPEFRGNVVAVQTAPYWDVRLAAIVERMDKVNRMQRMLRNRHRDTPNRDGTMTPDEQKQYLAKFRAETLLPGDAATLARGASNAGYHYLGCAKTMARIGQAFAEAALSMRR